MTRPPETLDEAVIEARAVLLELRAKLAAVSAEMRKSHCLSLIDEAEDLVRRMRTILDALRAADVHTDL